MNRPQPPIKAHAIRGSRTIRLPQPLTIAQLVSVLIAAILLLPPAAGAQTPEAVPEAAPQADNQCFYPVADAYVDSTNPSTNYGGDASLVVQHTDASATVKSSYLRFDLSPIPSGSTILDAELRLYLNQSSTSATYHLRRATSAWQEYNLTWNNRPSSSASYDAPIQTGSTGWKYWNAVQPVSDWVGGVYANHGLIVSSGLLEPPSPFVSRDNTTNLPLLCVEWTTSDTTIDLQVTGLEITQAVQNLDNDVRLVAGKRTFVRLHVDSNQGNWRTFATLAINCDGFGRVIHPVNPGTTGYIVVKTSPDRSVQNDAFLFELPSDCTDEAEQISLSGQVNPTTAWRGVYPPETNVANNWSGEYFVTFESVPKLDLIVYLADYEYDTGSGNASVSTASSHAYALQSWLERAYPIPDSWMHLRRYDWGEIKVNADGDITNPKASKFNKKLAAKRKWDLGHSNWYESLIGNERELRYYGMIDDEGGFMRGRATSKKPVSSGPTGAAWWWESDDSFGDWYGGHEIGHTLDRKHVLCDGDEKGWDRNYPHSGGLISGATTGNGAFFGFDIGNPVDGIYGPTYSDVMSYCDWQWISDYTTHGFMDYLQANLTAMPSGPQAQGSHILVVGSIDAASGATELEPLFVLPDVVDAEAPVPGDYDIVLRTAAGAELARYAFTPEPMDPGPPAPGTADLALTELLISEMVPFMAGTDQVSIEGPSGVLAQVTAGSSPPNITVLSPNGGESLSSDPVTVSWTASDGDGDDLSFSIEFSPDNGATWELVVHGITGNSFDVPRMNILSTSGQGLFRVWASDGIHTSSDTSDGGFTVTTRAPELTILSPVDGLVIDRQQTLNLQALAFSDLAGVIDGDRSALGVYHRRADRHRQERHRHRTFGRNPHHRRQRHRRRAHLLCQLSGDRRGQPNPSARKCGRAHRGAPGCGPTAPPGREFGPALHRQRQWIQAPGLASL